MGKKNNATLVSDADREIPTLRSRDNAGNLLNLVCGIVHLPSGLGFLCLHLGELIDSICPMGEKDRSKQTVQTQNRQQDISNMTQTTTSEATSLHI